MAALNFLHSILHYFHFHAAFHRQLYVGMLVLLSLKVLFKEKAS